MNGPLQPLLLLHLQSEDGLDVLDGDRFHVLQDQINLGLVKEKCSEHEVLALIGTLNVRNRILN